ncbi:MAG TPA: heavy metal translocating P-type ATPase [Thermoanaerobaculia bacterium]|nr:heavy metal translocating P-type ATPase [Thermoanaerobaculia bacterium]
MSRRQAFRVHGLDCAEEVAILKRELGALAGGEAQLGFDLVAGKLTLPASVDAEIVRARVAATGMHAEPWREGTPVEGAGAGRRAKAWTTAASGVLTLAGFAAHAALGGGFLAALSAGELEGAAGGEIPLLGRGLYLLAVVAGGWFVAPKALAAARRLRPDMNLLMTIAVLGALAIGQWFEAATVAFLFALSLALEAWSVGRARHAVEALLKLAPPVVRVVEADGSEREVAPAEVREGTRFRVRPGERIALDGLVVTGLSEADQAPITGESVPVAKAPGDEVFAGTINGRGALVVRSTKPASETVLARILRKVDEARSRRSPSEQWVERFARVYTPAVFAAALALALGGPLLLGISASDALYRGLALLVIGCPCALVVSTPVAVVAALAAAARHGVLIKGGRYVEEPARLVTVALDKTGTLTRGRPSVVEVVPLADHDERGLLERAAALEAHSDHPLARAIVAFARERGVRPAAAESFEIHPGKGASGRIGGRLFWIGSHRYLEERGEETPAVHERIEAMSLSGRTIVVVGNESHVCGLVALADEVRPEARAAIRDLHAAGVRNVVMLTGDHAPTAQVVARECGIDEVRSELLPEEKLAVIEELVERDGHVAMVGDGVNDAPALARSTIGIAMGAAGTDAAIETADVALMADDLSRLPWLVRHSRRTLAVIRADVGFALAVKAVFVVLALAGWATLWGAIAADMGATLVVIANALRLLRG